MKEMSLNERAKRGIPSFAIMDDKTSISRYEGFDADGNLWLRYCGLALEPDVKSGSYLCLRPLKNARAAYGLNGELYAFVVSNGKDHDTVFGYVTGRDMEFGELKVLSHLQSKEFNYIRIRDVIESYVVTACTTILPSSFRF